MSDGRISNRVRFMTGAGLLLGSLALGSACSPGSLFGQNKEDGGVLRPKSARQLEPSCAGMDLRAATLDVPAFRSLLHCFNAEGALDRIEAWVRKLPDSDLAPIVEAA